MKTENEEDLPPRKKHRKMTRSKAAVSTGEIIQIINISTVQKTKGKEGTV